MKTGFCFITKNKTFKSFICSCWTLVIQIKSTNFVAPHNLKHRSRLLRTNPRRYFIASGVIFLIMYSKFTIPPLVEIRPVITQRVMFRFREIRPKFPACIIYGDPFRVIIRVYSFPSIGRRNSYNNNVPNLGVNSGYRRCILCRNCRNSFLSFPYINPL